MKWVLKKSDSATNKQTIKNASSASSNTYGSAKEGIIANLNNSKIFDKFIEKINESSKSKNINLHNGVNLSFNDVGWSNNNDDNFKDTIKLNVKLKKGFAFKNFFNLQTTNQLSKTNSTFKYNTNDKTSEVSFGINHDSSSSSSAAIYKNENKTVEQIASDYSSKKSS